MWGKRPLLQAIRREKREEMREGLRKEFGFEQFAENMADGDVTFLNSSSIFPADDDWKINALRHLPAVFASEGNRFQPLLPGFFQRQKHVRGVSAGADSHRDVSG